MTPLEKMDTSTDETESCGVGNHVSVVSTCIRFFQASLLPTIITHIQRYQS